jgi:hypothetical protein
MPDSPIYEVRWVARGPDPLTGSGDHDPWPHIPSMTTLSLLGQPDQNAPCETILKACFDDRNLYLYSHCTDTEIIATYTQRDQMLWEQDVVEAFLCPQGDRRRYYEFNFSPRGVIFDAIINNPDLKRSKRFAFDKTWNAPNLRIAVAGKGRLYGNATDDQHWSVEAAIPFADLGVAAPADAEEWPVNLFRIERAGGKNLFCTWAPLPDPAPGFHQSDCFGLFVFRR